MYKNDHQLRLVVILVVLTKRKFRISLIISQLLAKAIPVRGAKFKKPAFEQAFCFFASLTLTQHRIQPGKHLVDNDVRYAFQTLAVPYRLPTPRVSSVNAPQLSLKKRLPVG
ncbi:TPA: hypothetical protein QH902_000474 [Klebsiella pneumoniae subsp. pneumoniae]|nr:hypothetical protein AN2346V1_1613 [Klebsiella pneumoniae]CAH6027552.1 hypothetical protein AN2346V1_1613 [Klebsiella pneumoniae]HCK0257345.1 hypothetical protein [Klebsiella pneumoniae]HDS9490483.1 hypothetical protein [Klebsiella pneumoniae subsp. pneumoniae]